MRPTKKAFSLSFAALLLFGVGANAQAGWLYVIGASIIGVVAAGLIIPHRILRSISVQRLAPDFASVDDEIDVTLQITNAGRGAKLVFSGSDEFLGPSLFVVRSMQAGSSVSAVLTKKVDRRGVHHGGRVELRSGAPFGVAIAKRSTNVASKMTVHPRWVPLSGFPLLESASAPNESLHDRSRRGAGMDFYGLRQYRPGDSPRLVHWASTARGGQLMVREFEEQLASRLTVLIDASSPIGVEPMTTFEDAVSVAASLVIYALDVGHPVQLFADSKGGLRHLFEPTKVQTLDWLAEVEADGRRGLMRTADTILPEVFRRSTVVMVFPSSRRNVSEAPAATAALQQGGARVIAVMVAAHTYGRSADALTSAEAEALETEMARRRAIVFRIEADKEMADCLRVPLLV